MKQHDSTHSWVIRTRLRTSDDGDADQLRERVQETHAHWDEKIREAIANLPGVDKSNVADAGWEG